MQTQHALAVFEGTAIRRKWHNEEWWFAVPDVIGALIESRDPGVYWRVMKNRLQSEGSNQTVTNCNGLKMVAADGKMRVVDCANPQTLLRIIQSIPSPKAEPFKQWLASVGYERLKEIENPELASQRARALYEAKGYDKAWIEKRLRGIQVREELTREWDERGVRGTREYAILTAEITKATFGLAPTEYKKAKGLARPHNLRDHMTDLELIFTMLGEAATTEITRTDDAQGFVPNRKAAIAGGTVAGRARKDLEKRTGKKVVTRKNYLPKSK